MVLPVGHAEGQAVYEILLSFWLEIPFKLLSHAISLFLLMYLRCPTEVINRWSLSLGKKRAVFIALGEDVFHGCTAASLWIEGEI